MERKYRTVTLYYPEHVTISAGRVGEYIHELFHSGIDAIQILRQEQPHSHHHHDEKVPDEQPR